jgi:hypothetical protein
MPSKQKRYTLLVKAYDFIGNKLWGLALKYFEKADYYDEKLAVSILYGPGIEEENDA